MIVNLTVRSRTISLQVAALNTAAPGGGGGVTDHGALTGLADDDHPQYHNNARGDARYDALGAATSAVSAHAGATDPHGDRAFATAAVGTHAAAAGAHPMSGVDGLTAALALLAPLLSPALTGTPTTPTAAPGTASTQIASTAFVAAAIAALLNSAPGALDTLDELAAALGDDPNFASTVTSALAGKLAKASNLADLVDAAAARANLGATTIGGQVFTAADAAAIRSLLTLGAAALLGVGTTAGTVAAGDDSRFTSAIDASRLPAPTTTALGGVKRNTGSAGQFVTGIDADGSLLRDTPAGGGGTATLAVFLPNQNQPPASGFATLDTRNSVLVLDFDDAAIESACFVGVIPEGADLSSGIVVSIRWMATSATTGNVRWRAEFEADGTDLDSDSFDTATEATGAANGTSGIETTTDITCTTIDSLAAGDRFRLRISRVGNDGTNDTMSGDAELVAVELRAA